MAFYDGLARDPKNEMEGEFAKNDEGPTRARKGLRLSRGRGADGQSAEWGRQMQGLYRGVQSTAGPLAETSASLNVSAADRRAAPSSEPAWSRSPRLDRGGPRPMTEPLSDPQSPVRSAIAIPQDCGTRGLPRLPREYINNISILKTYGPPERPCDAGWEAHGKHW